MNRRPAMGGGFAYARPLARAEMHAGLARFDLCGIVPLVNKLTTTDPAELRPLIHERIDQCTPAELEAVRKTLLMLEARRLADELGEEMAEDWRAGKFTTEKIAEVLREHRAKHPYR